MNLDVSTDSGMKYAYENINNKVAKKVNNPIVLAILVAVVILYVILFNVMGKNAAKVQARVKPPSTKIIELFAWALFLLLVFINGLQYFFEINVQTVVKNLFDKNPQIGIKIKPNINIQLKLFYSKLCCYLWLFTKRNVTKILVL